MGHRRLIGRTTNLDKIPSSEMTCLALARLHTLSSSPHGPRRAGGGWWPPRGSASHGACGLMELLARADPLQTFGVQIPEQVRSIRFWPGFYQFFHHRLRFGRSRPKQCGYPDMGYG